MNSNVHLVSAAPDQPIAANGRQHGQTSLGEASGSKSDGQATDVPCIKKKPRRRPLVPGLLRAPQAAAFCNVSPASWARLHAAAKVPAPIRLGGCVCWNRRELLRWIDHNCPSRREWEEIWRTLLAARNWQRQ